ncbi:hypothetical protein TELCIR_12828, partial [Teladorsagia circumcincta]
MENEFFPDRQHLRHVTLFLYHSGSNMKAAETKMRDVCKDYALSYGTIVRWYKRFKVGDYTLEDEERSGRPSELNLSELRRVVKTDPFQSTREMASTLGVQSSTIESGLKKLGMKKRLGRYAPHRLKPVDRDRRDDNKKLLPRERGLEKLSVKEELSQRGSTQSNQESGPKIRRSHVAINKLPSMFT